MRETTHRAALEAESFIAVEFANQDSEDPFPCTIKRDEYSYNSEWKDVQKGHDRKGHWKSFQHYVRRNVSQYDHLAVPTIMPMSIYRTGSSRLNRYTQPSERWNWPWSFGAYGAWDNSLPALSEIDEDGVRYIPAPALLSDLVATSFRVMLPRIRSDLSILNSLLELKDFKKLGQTARSLRTTAQALAKGLSGKSLRELLRSVGDGWLQAKFNFIPLYRDILGFRQALRDITVRSRKAMSYEGTPRTWHFRHTWREFDDIDVTEFETDAQHRLSPLIGEPSGYHMSAATSVRQEVKYDPTVFHAQLKFNASYSIAQETFTPLLVLLDSLGVNLNPAIVWNAIPWSFVIDWILKVGDHLDKLAIRNMDPQIHIVDYLWSVKRSRTNHVSAKTVATQWFIPGSPAASITYEPISEVAYRRDVGVPDMSSIIQSSGLSSNELSLVAALAVTRKKQRRVNKPKSKSKRYRVRRR